MTVTRKIKMTFETDEVQVGDQIEVVLKDFGRFTATAQKVMNKDGILFLFDEVIANRPMNKSNTNAGGFEESDMNRWLHDTVLPAFYKNPHYKIIDITLPTYGEIFGHYYNRNFYSLLEPDEDSQFDLMRLRNDRTSAWDRWWLRNAVKQNVSSTYFACVNYDGYVTSGNASNANIGVRPKFKMIIKS